jgi:hypothetical protein
LNPNEKTGKSHNEMGWKILRKIYGPTYEIGYWRIKMNQEVYKTRNLNLQIMEL